MVRTMGVTGFKAMLAGLMLVAGAAQAREMAGVRVPDSLTVEGHQVPLAHIALHQQFFFKVYVWSLYIEQPAHRNAEAIAANCIKRLHFRFLRNVNRSQLVDAFRDGLSKNPALRGAPLNQDFERLLSSLRDVPEGGDLIITYLPEGGLRVGGEASGGINIPGKAFADALFVSWLQEHPVFGT
jgi:hypothetical protein